MDGPSSATASQWASSRSLVPGGHLAAIVDDSDDAIVSKDLAGTILTWNAAATQMYGYTAEEALGQSIDIVIPEDERSRAEELDIRRRIAEGERIHHTETVRRHKDGRHIEVSLSMSPVRDASGTIVAAAGIARDISERKLFVAKQHLAAIVDNSDDTIVSRDLDGTILTWNEAATRMYGYTAEEALGQPIDIVIPEDERYRAEELDIRRRIAEGEPIQHTETVRRHKDGRHIEVSLSISPVRDASGRIVAAAGIARDISERNRAFETTQRLAAIVDNSDDAIVSIDLGGTILSWNAAAVQMYGYTAEEALGQPIDIVIPEDEYFRAQELDIRRRIAEGQRIHHTETVRRHKNGRHIEISLSMSPVRDASGEIVAAAGIARDISERKLFQVRQHLAAIVDNSDDAIVSKDLAGTILTWNEAATRMYGYTAEEALGQPIDVVIPEDERYRAEELDIRRRIAEGERIHHTETVRRHKDGRRIEVSLSISPVRDASGRIVAAAGSARDVSERNRAFETTQRLAAIVDNSDDAIVAKDLDGTILTWNAAATQMYGYTAEEALGMPIDIVIPEDEYFRAQELDIRRRIAEGGRIHHTQTVRRHKDGRRIEVSLSMSPVRDASGRIVAAAGIARDVSEQNRAFGTTQRMAAIVDNSDDAIVAKDLDGTILTWNAAATQMYGYTEEEALGRSIDIVIPEDEYFRAQELDIRRRIAEGQRIHHTETLRRHKDGRQIEVSLSMSPVRDASGEIVAAAGIARDISERKLFLTSQHLAAIVDNSDDAIVSKDRDGTILSWNAAATWMYGYSAEEALGMPIDIVIPEDEYFRAQELDIRRRIAEGERIQHRETKRRSRNGVEIDVSLSVSPVRDASGRIIAAADIARDISDRKRLEQEREGATGLLQRFVDFAAHDFKTPMHHILWYGQEAARLVGECQAGEGSEECLAQVQTRLQKIVDNSRWMNRSTEALLRASGLQGHRQVRTQVSAQKAFDDALAMLRSVDAEVEEAIVTRGPLPVLASDESLLGFLFQNLLTNACKFGKVGQRVEVHVSAVKRGSEWLFTVADNGMGVEPHLREAIFEPHVRAPDVEAPGVGIGLTFCRRIVDWHGGRIWVRPGRGGGSRFSFTIPDEVVVAR